MSELRKQFESYKQKIENEDPLSEVFEIAVNQLRLLALLDNIDNMLFEEIVELDDLASHKLVQLKKSLSDKLNLEFSQDELSHPESPLNETINSYLSAD